MPRLLSSWEYLNRSDQVKLDPYSRAKVRGQGWEDATQSKRPSKKMSYKDETQSYFDASANSTQIKFERDTDRA
jgi:hypothetical protein